MEEKLIKFVHDNPCLYDHKHITYKDQALKDKKWMEFSKEVNMPVDLIKRRWKSLRDRFFRLRKIEASVSTDRFKYKYYENLRFLCDVDKRKSVNNVVRDGDPEKTLLQSEVWTSQNSESAAKDKEGEGMLLQREEIFICDVDTSNSSDSEIKKEMDVLSQSENRFLDDVETSNNRNISDCEIKDEIDEEFLMESDVRFICDAETFNNRSSSDCEVKNEAIEEISLHSEDNCHVDDASSLSTPPLKEKPKSTPTKNSHNSDAVETEMLNVLRTIKESASPNTTPFRAFLECIALTVENSNLDINEITRIQVGILRHVQTAILNKHNSK